MLAIQLHRTFCRVRIAPYQPIHNRRVKLTTSVYIARRGGRRIHGSLHEIEQRFQERGHQAVSPNLHQPQMKCRITRKAFLTRFLCSSFSQFAYLYPFKIFDL